jgi:hypothetical protein
VVLFDFSLTHICFCYKVSFRSDIFLSREAERAGNMVEKLTGTGAVLLYPMEAGAPSLESLISREAERVAEQNMGNMAEDYELENEVVLSLKYNFQYLI